MAVEKAALDYSNLNTMTEARESLEKALEEMQDTFARHSMQTVKRRLKKRANEIQWPVVHLTLPTKH